MFSSVAHGFSQENIPSFTDSAVPAEAKASVSTKASSQDRFPVMSSASHVTPARLCDGSGCQLGRAGSERPRWTILSHS